MRVALPNANVLIHQPSGGAQGQATDIEIQAREILRIRHRMNELMSKHTGQPMDVIERSVERDKIFDAQGAKGVRAGRRGDGEAADAGGRGVRAGGLDARSA